MLSEFKREWKHPAKQYPEETKKTPNKEKKSTTRKNAKAGKSPFMGISSEVY